jgi:hypothetical protein
MIKSIYRTTIIYYMFLIAGTSIGTFTGTLLVTLTGTLSETLDLLLSTALSTGTSTSSFFTIDTYSSASSNTFQ